MGADIDHHRSGTHENPHHEAGRCRRRDALVTPGEATPGRGVRLLTLADGRTLAWHEFGDPAGSPYLYVPGTPESGLAGRCYDAAAREAGVRWISVDKPGYGGSDPLRARRLADWPRDAAALADHLGLDRFTVAGESGGGPHALALGLALPERARVVVLLASAGVVDAKDIPPGMTALNTLLFRCLRLDHRLVRLPFAGLAFLATHEQRFPRLLGLLARGVPPVDQRMMADPDYASRLAAGAEAFRHGSRPAAEEFLLLQAPWGLALSELSVPVHAWHGGADAHVPLALAKALRRELPDVTTHVDDEAGHTVGFQHRREVMELITSAGA
jgi:pimeloyl-ACP methyl ester carboxylesterase